MTTKETMKCSHRTLVKGRFCSKCGKKLNVLERLFATKEQIDDNDTHCICNTCFGVNLFKHNFCSNCGNNLKNSVSTLPANPSMLLKHHVELDAESEYLYKIGLLHLAQETFNIKIQIENGECTSIQLKGYQKSSDALKKLEERGVLSNNKFWRFTNWPTANPCIGPFYHRVSACVCELEMDKIYYVESYDMRDIRVLYGCPNPASINYSSRLDMVCVEVVDYEKQ